MKYFKIQTKRFIQSSLVLVALLIGPACNNEDFFELTNPPEFPWLNMSELEFGAVAPYKIALQSGWGGHMLVANRVIIDCMTDAFYLLPGTASDYPAIEIYRRETETQLSRVNNSFSAAYRTIATTNSLLDFLYENNREPFPNMTSSDRANIDRIEGEMLFLRAFAYYNLLVMNAPAPGNPNFSSLGILPLRLTFPENADEANSPEFVSAERIYQQALEDLTKAKELLPARFDASLHHASYEHGRVDKYTAAAMLSRVQFHLGNHTESLAEADFVINSGQYTLDEDPIEAFNRDNPTKGNEVIWYGLYYDDVAFYTPKDATLFNLSDYRARNGGRGEDFKRVSWHQFTMSNSIMQQVGWMDSELNETDEARTDKRYQQLFYRLEGNNGDLNADPLIYETQYPEIKEPRIWADKYYRGADGQLTNVPVLRVAEMYLNRAIIRFNNGDAAGATADVNLVRRRAGLADLPTVTAQDIHNERIKELSQEGDRLGYLQGLGMDIPAGDRDAGDVIPYPYEEMYWKIPQSELDFQESDG